MLPKIAYNKPPVDSILYHKDPIFIFTQACHFSSSLSTLYPNTTQTLLGNHPLALKREANKMAWSSQSPKLV